MSVVGPHVIALAKIVEYLLNPAHPANGGKATFFLSHGFDPSVPSTLTDALRDHACARPTVKQFDHPHGTSFVVRCALATPDGRNPCISAVWFQDHGSATYRLVTAYPARISVSEQPR